MKKLFSIFLVSIFLASGFTLPARAQMMMPGLRASDINWNEVVEHTLREEKEGKELWEKLEAKKIQCANLSDKEFGALGEYFMGVMTGDSHAAMNAMMMQMHGEEGEEQIHIAMGKRLSGCDTFAVIPYGGGGWMPMMMGRWDAIGGGGGFPMMGSFGFGGGIFMLLWWILIIVAVVALIKWLITQANGGQGMYQGKKSPREILEERYAKGEIDKKNLKRSERFYNRLLNCYKRTTDELT